MSPDTFVHKRWSGCFYSDRSSGDRALFYVDDMAGAEKLKEDLTGAVSAAIADEEPDNPIYRGKAAIVIKDSKNIPDAQKLVIERLVDRFHINVAI